MPYRGRSRKTCKVCGGLKSEVGSLSARGKCKACGIDQMGPNLVALKTHKGPYFDHWRKQCLAAFGVTVDTDER